MKKKILLALLMAVLACTALSAHDFEVDGIYYLINKDSVSVSVTYRGSYYASGRNTYSGHVIIPPEVTYNGVTYPVTKIGGYAFDSCTDLTEVELPNTITEIGRYSFEVSRALRRVNIPDSVTFIGVRAFAWCGSLEELYIPASVQTIESTAFECCLGLTSIAVDEDNPYFDSRDNCNAVISKSRDELVVACVNTVLPNSVRRLGSNAFDGFSWLTEINLPDSLEYIGEYAFYGCTGLTSIEIPSTVTTIGDCAFASCTGLTEVELPSSLVDLGGCVFMDCTGLTSVHIPANVTSVGHYLISRAYNVSSITVDPNNRRFDSRDNCNAIISKSYDRLVIGCSGSTVPEGVTGIEMGAFAHCINLTHIEFPSSLLFIDSEAFMDCTGLTSIVLPGSFRNLNMEAFRNCTNLKSLTLPASLQYMEMYAFYGCDNLRDVTCLGTTPPRMESNKCFSSIAYNNATLHVPAEAIETYQSTYYWNYFSAIDAIRTPGDINGDGSITVSDAVDIINQMLDAGNAELPAYCDVNGDGTVNIADITFLINMLLNATN